VKPIEKTVTFYRCSCCNANYDNKEDAELCCSALGISYEGQWALWDRHISLHDYDRPNKDCGHGERRG